MSDIVGVDGEALRIAARVLAEKHGWCALYRAPDGTVIVNPGSPGPKQDTIDAFEGAGFEMFFAARRGCL